MRLTPARIDKHLIFRETFDSVKSVTDNDGVITGTPTINNRGDFTVADYVSYAKRNGVATALSFRWKGKFTLTGSDQYGGLGGFGTAVVTFNQYAGLCRTNNDGYFTMNIGSGSSFMMRSTASQLVTDTEYEIVGAWNGSAIHIYVNGVISDGATSGSVSSINMSTFTNLFINNFAGRNMIQNCKLFEVYKTSLSAEEVKDLYEQDTYSEIEHPLIDLPLRSWYYKENGTELVTNGDFSSGTTGWTAWNATLTDEGGYMRVADNGIFSHAYQSFSTVAGARYRVTARSRPNRIGGATYNGSIQIFLNNDPAKSDFGDYQFYPGAADVWTDIVGEFVATGANTAIGLASNGSDYAEFDDISVQLMEAQTENKGSLGGAIYLGDKTTTTTFPTFNAPHRVTTDGGDYLDTGLTTLLDLSDKWTFEILYKGDLSASANYLFFGNVTTAGLHIGLYSTTGYFCAIRKDGSNYFQKYVAAKPANGLHHVVFTYDGSGSSAGIKIYDNCIAKTVVGGDVGTVTDVDNGTSYRFLGNTAGGFLPSGTSIYGTNFHKGFEATPMQIRKMCDDMINNMNV